MNGEGIEFLLKKHGMTFEDLYGRRLPESSLSDAAKELLKKYKIEIAENESTANQEDAEADRQVAE